MVRRLLVLVSALTLLVPSAALAQDPPLDRTLQWPEPQTIDPQILPSALNDARPVNVMLEMRGDPVTVVQSQRPNKLSKAERDALKAQLKARQDAIKGQIGAAGGKVLAQVQLAYNGVKVRIARNKVAALAELPNVIAVRGIQQFSRENVTSVPFIGVPEGVWENHGLTGAGVKIAVIDTGIDYTHANFGGPGTVEAYQLADANDTTIGDAGDAGFFGEGAPKVKGGIDLVGDAYDGGADPGSPALIPHPDPDPLDCKFTSGSVGHGSHVSGTATGFGVLADGSTYEGPYDDTTHTNDFEIGPGVAPEADLYFVRVFGCDGSTDVTVEAIEWAVEHDMDVINMSLGSSFGRSDDPSAVASTNAAAAGVTVVTSAGNSGSAPYITGSPGTADGSIATAAIDSNAQFPGVSLALSTGGAIDAISANGTVPENGTSYNVVVLTNDPATAENEALGCSVAAYTKAGVAPGGNQLAVAERGTCARVARAVFGEQAGAAAVAMINNASTFPPFEGPILSNPDTGEEFTVTIPFFGVRGPGTPDGGLLKAASSVTTTAKTLVNPGLRGFASFSSGGPRNGDSGFKPDITAPGVSTISTAAGTGDKGYVLSGTSMASPHVAGVAALVRQAHPEWSPEEVKAAIVNTGNPAEFAAGGYSTTRGGTGVVSPAAAVATDVVALGDEIPGDESIGLSAFHNSSLSYGFAELDANFSGTRTITVKNFGEEDVTISAAQAAGPGSRPSSMSFSPSSVVVPHGGEATIDVTLTVPAATVGSSAALRQVSGAVVLTGDGVNLRVPYLLVPRALSKVTSSLSGNLTPNGVERTLTFTNPGGVIPGGADVYQWGLEDGNDVNEAVFGGGGYDLRAIGAQAFPDGDDSLIVFAVSTHDRWSTAAVNEFDILINVDDDKDAEYAVVAVDLGAVLTGSFNGQVGSFVFDLVNGGAVFNGTLFASPTDSSTLLIQLTASQLGLTPADGNFEYTAVSFSLEGPGVDPMKGKAGFNPFTPALTNFPFEGVAPGGSASAPVAIDPVAFDAQKMLGVMVVTHDNASGAGEAQLIQAPGRGR